MSLEEKIDLLVAALDRNTAALNSDEAGVPVNGDAAPKKRGRKPANETSTQQAAPSATPATATAPATVAGPATQSPVVSVLKATPEDEAFIRARSTKPAAELDTGFSGAESLWFAASEATLILAAMGRQKAVDVLAKPRGANGERAGVTRCSSLNKLDWRDVFNEMRVAILAVEAEATTAKANESLV